MKKLAIFLLAFQMISLHVASAADPLPPPAELKASDPPELPSKNPLPPLPLPQEKENPAPDPHSLRLNEILPNPLENEADGEFIEIFNAGDKPINLSGWQLRDNEIDEKKVFVLSSPGQETLLAPGEYLAFFRPETGILLNNDQDTVTLLDPHKDVIDSFVFEKTSPGRSWGRSVDFPEEWVLLKDPTPAAENIQENAPPVAQIDLQNPFKGLTVNVTGENSLDPDGDPLTFLWEFEPGQSVEGMNPPAHVFETPGDYVIRLTVTDPWGLKGETEFPFTAVLEEEKKPEVPSKESQEGKEPLPEKPLPPPSKPLPEPSKPAPLPPKESQPYFPGMIEFDSALPNPEGPDTGKEKIVLQNTTAHPLDLKGWKIKTGKTQKVLESYLLPAHQQVTLNSEAFKVSLKNEQGHLALLSPADQDISQMSWEKAASGQWVINLDGLNSGVEVEALEGVDGDTLKIQWKEKTLDLRLIGVDAPETKHPFKPVEYYGLQASAYLKELVEGKTLRLEFDQNKTDYYGRLLAYVYVEDRLVNAKMIEEGYAHAYTRYPFKKAAEFLALQQEAQVQGRGLWGHPEVVEALEKEKGEEGIEKEEKPLKKHEMEQEEDVDNQEEKRREEKTESSLDDSSAMNSSCQSADLKIDSFLPSPQKGVSEEFIKLINKGAQAVCLKGWQLDDSPEGGSKPFTFKEGQIEAGEIGVFKKEMTKISLNNMDDCVTLIDPSGDVADQICYQTSHPNEIFTPVGGNWVAPKKEPPHPSSVKKKIKAPKNTSVKKSTTKTQKEPSQKHRFTRDSSAYRQDLHKTSFKGTLLGRDEEEKMLIVELENKKILPVSFAHSFFDMSLIPELMDLHTPLKFETYKTADGMQLISVYDEIQGKAGLRAQKIPWGYAFLFLIGASAGLLVWKNRIFFKRLFHPVKENQIS